MNKFVKNLVLILIIIFLSKAKAFKDYSYISDVKTLIESNITSLHITEIGTGLLKVKNKINAIKNSKNIPNLNICNKFFSIGKELLAYRDLITDQKVFKNHEKHKTSLKHLIIFYDVLCNEMIELRKNVENFEDMCSKSAAVKAITTYKFEEAEEILKSFKVESIILNIVHKLYNDSETNLNLLLDFTESLTSISLCTLMVNAIHNELEIHNHKDLHKMVELIRILELRILNQEHFHQIYRFKAINIHKIITNFLKENSTSIMETKLLNHTLISDTKIAQFLGKLYKFNSKLSNKILFNVIDRVFEKLTATEIIDRIFLHLDIPQRKNAINYMYTKLKNLKLLDTGILKLAQYTYDILKFIFPKKKFNTKPVDILITIWLEIPLSIQNLLVAESVCLKNVENLEYLQTETEPDFCDSRRRNIVSKISQEREPEKVWYVKNQLGNEQFQFVNKKYHNEYLYGEGELNENKDYIHTYTSKLPEQDENKKFFWYLEVFGPNLRIKNVYDSQLLCILSLQTQNSTNNVVALKDYNDFANNNICLWEVIACE